MRLLWNLVLALFWAALWGSLSLSNLVSGLVLGYFSLMLLERAELIENKHYGRRVWRSVTFALFFVRELVLANFRVALDVLRPSPKFRPAIVKIPLDLTGEAQITLYSSVITLTPGTLTLDISPDQKHIYIHAMFFDPARREEFTASLKNGFEKRIRELFAT